MIINRQVGIGVARGVCPERNYPVAEVKIQRIGNRDVRTDNRGFRRVFSQFCGKFRQEEGTVLLHFLNQVFMADEFRSKLLERDIAQHVVKVNMGIDHVAYRQGGFAFDGLFQGETSGHGAASVNDSNAFVSDYEAYIGYIVVVRVIQVHVFTLVDVNSLTDAGQVEHFFLFFGSMGVTGQCGKQA